MREPELLSFLIYKAEKGLLVNDSKESFNFLGDVAGGKLTDSTPSSNIIIEKQKASFKFFWIDINLI